MKTVTQSDCTKQTNDACVNSLQSEVHHKLGNNMLGGTANVFCQRVRQNAQVSQIERSATTRLVKLRQQGTVCFACLQSQQQQLQPADFSIQ